MEKEEEIKLCPLCNGKAEVLDICRNLIQQPSRTKYEIICMECGLTLKCDISLRISIIKWNTRFGKEKMEKEIDAIKLLELYKASNFSDSGKCDAEGRQRIRDAILEIHHLVAEKNQYKQMAKLRYKMLKSYDDIIKKKK